MLENPRKHIKPPSREKKKERREEKRKKKNWKKKDSQKAMKIDRGDRGNWSKLNPH